jgi:hypothetical protein
MPVRCTAGSHSGSGRQGGATSFSSIHQRLVNDTSASVLRGYQQGNRDGLMNIINRDPLIAGKVLINLLRQTDKLEQPLPLPSFFQKAVALSWKSPSLIFS